MDKSKNQADTVGNTEEVSNEAKEEDGALNENQAAEDGILSIGFEEEIEVVETYVAPESIMDLDTAINMVTKEQEQNKVYEVVSGDCLSVVAEKTTLPLRK